MSGAQLELAVSSAEFDLQDRLRTRLASGIQVLSLDITDAQQTVLLNYLALLNKWNRAYNLTAVRDPEEMISRHLLDSLVALPELRGSRIADVGTGAGIPGIPLAIMRPDIHFALIDSNGKKTRFLFEAQSRLSLRNISIHSLRVENFQPDCLFDMVLSRAYASLAQIVDSTAQLLTPTGVLLAWKGQYPAEEIAQLGSAWQIAKVVEVAIPGEIAPRHLLAIERVHVEEAA